MTEPIKRQWTLRIHSNNDGGGYIYSGDDVSYPEDDYLEVISADWVAQEIRELNAITVNTVKKLYAANDQINRLKETLKEARHALMLSVQLTLQFKDKLYLVT